MLDEQTQKAPPPLDFVERFPAPPPRPGPGAREDLGELCRPAGLGSCSPTRTMRCGTCCSRGRSICLAAGSSRSSSTGSTCCGCRIRAFRSLASSMRFSSRGPGGDRRGSRDWCRTRSSSRCSPSGCFRSAISSASARSSIISRRRTASTICSGISRCWPTTTFAEMVEHVGRLGSAAIAAGEGHRMARIYWHSVEFGLAREHGELKILGAGLASSFGEAHFSLESDAVERLPFSVGEGGQHAVPARRVPAALPGVGVAGLDGGRGAGADAGGVAGALARGAL